MVRESIWAGARVRRIATAPTTCRDAAEHRAPRTGRMLGSAAMTTPDDLALALPRVARVVAEYVQGTVAHLGAYALLVSIGEQPETQEAEEELAYAAAADRTWVAIEVFTWSST